LGFQVKLKEISALKPQNLPFDLAPASLLVSRLDSAGFGLLAVESSEKVAGLQAACKQGIFAH
jgi:hypothetical protein